MSRKISRTEIDRMIEGGARSGVDYEPFVIIKEKITSLINRNVSWAWKVVCNPFCRRNKVFVIQRDEALQIIENLGMSEACNTNEGKVFERPDRPFYRSYHGKGAQIPENFAS